MYGIYSHVSKKFVYGIREPTKSKAWKKLKEHIGKDVYKWRFQAVKIDDSNDMGGLNMEIKVLLEAPALTAVLERLIGILEKGQALNVLQGADKEVAQAVQQESPKKRTKSKKEAAPVESGVWTAGGGEQDDSVPAEEFVPAIPSVVDLRAVAQEKGKTAEGKKAIKVLLEAYESKSISTVPEEKRADFLKELKAL